MTKSEESPHTTRRRVWCFAFVSLVVVAVFSLWPRKGYRIDLGAFGTPFASPLSEGQELWSVGDGGYWVNLTFVGSETDRGGQQFLSINRVMAGLPFVGGDRPVVTEVIELPEFNARIHSYEGDRLKGFILLFGRCNIAGSATVRELPAGTSEKEAAIEILTAIYDDLDREIPGVTTFYNPPARQLYYDRLRPYFRKLFPQALAP